MMFNMIETDGTEGNNQPEMTHEQATKAAVKYAREAGREVTKGNMSLTKFVSVLLPLAHVTKQYIKADQAKTFWVERNEAAEDSATDAFKSKVNFDSNGKEIGNSKAANGSKLKQALMLANTVDYATELHEDTLAEIGRLLKAGVKCKSPYPAFVDVCRAQLKDKDTRLTREQIAEIVTVGTKESTELSKLEAAAKALKAASKIREEAGEPVDTGCERALSHVEDRIAVIKQVALQVAARAAAVAAGLTVV
jgi:hypothetical protein